MPICPLVITWTTDIDTDHCCCRTMDPDMVLRGTTGQDITMALGGNAGFSHQATPSRVSLITFTAPVLPLFIVCKPLLLFSLSLIFFLPHTCSLAPSHLPISYGSRPLGVFCLPMLYGSRWASLSIDLTFYYFVLSSSIRGPNTPPKWLEHQSERKKVTLKSLTIGTLVF